MPAKIFLIPNKVNKDLLKFPLWVQNKITQALRQIKENPASGIKLQGELKDYYKMRVGDYRIIYYFEPKTASVQVLKIEHRQGVYR